MTIQHTCEHLCVKILTSFLCSFFECLTAQLLLDGMKNRVVDILSGEAKYYNADLSTTT